MDYNTRTFSTDGRISTKYDSARELLLQRLGSYASQSECRRGKLLEINQIAMIAKISSSRSEDLIRRPFHYRHKNSEGSWSTDYNPDNELTDDIWEGVLTFDSLKQLLFENLIAFPTITEDEINDRSKGDALSKGIALFKLTWFIAQIITRAAQGLAISELELTTAVLAGLNSIMYIFWRSKPRDVRFPVEIQTKGVEGLLATKTEDVTWSFPYQEFDFRRHLWSATTTSIKWLRRALARFFASFTGKVKHGLSRFCRGVKAFSQNVTLSVSHIWRYSVRFGGRSKKEEDAGQRRDRHEWKDDGQEGLNEGPELINVEVPDEAHPSGPVLSQRRGARIKVSHASYPVSQSIYMSTA